MFKYIINIPVQLIQRIQAALVKTNEALKKPLRSDVLTIKSLIMGLIVASGVLAVFSLTNFFEIGSYTAADRPLLLGLVSLAAFLGIALTDFGLPLLFAKYFDKSQWTVSRQVALNTMRVFFVGLLVMVFSNQTDLAKFDLPMILLKFTLAGGVIGLILAFVKESSLRSKYKAKAESLNEKLKDMKAEDSRGLQVLVFKGSNDSITIVPNQLISLETDKYQSHFSFQNLFGTVEKSLDILQESVVSEVRKYEQFCELNAGVFVNKLALYKVSADASGLHLHVAKKPTPIRVTPKFESRLKNI